MIKEYKKVNHRKLLIRIILTLLIEIVIFMFLYLGTQERILLITGIIVITLSTWKSIFLYFIGIILNRKDKLIIDSINRKIEFSKRDQIINKNLDDLIGLHVYFYQHSNESWMPYNIFCYYVFYFKNDSIITTSLLTPKLIVDKTIKVQYFRRFFPIFFSNSYRKKGFNTAKDLYESDFIGNMTEKWFDNPPKNDFVVCKDLKINGL